MEKQQFLDILEACRYSNDSDHVTLMTGILNTKYKNKEFSIYQWCAILFYSSDSIYCSLPDHLILYSKNSLKKDDIFIRLEEYNKILRNGGYYVTKVYSEKDIKLAVDIMLKEGELNEQLKYCYE